MSEKESATTIKLVCLDPGDRSVGIPDGEFTVQVTIGDPHTAGCGDYIFTDPEQRAFLIADLKKVFLAYLENGGSVLTEEESAEEEKRMEQAYGPGE